MNNPIIIATRIRNWDKTNIYELKELLEQLKQTTDYPETYIDMTSLPSEPIPTGMENYPIRAIDKQGLCLVGDTKIVTFNEVLKAYE